MRNKNEKRRFIGVCKHVGCPWRIYDAQYKRGLTFVIKLLNEEYTCFRVTKNRDAYA